MIGGCGTMPANTNELVWFIAYHRGKNGTSE
jgi:hypothetical protein